MSTAFQPTAFQSDAFQIDGGVASGAITGSLDYTNKDDTFRGTANLGGAGVLEPEFLGWPNVRIRGLKKEKPRVEEPVLPAEISNMPGAPAPKRIGKIELALLGMAPPVTELPAPDLPTPTVVAAKKPPEPPAEPVAEMVAPEPPPAPEPIAAPAPDPLAVLQEMLAAQGTDLRKEMTAQAKAFRSEIQGLKTALADAQLVIEQMQAENRTRDLAERNRRRAEEITRRLLAE